ncbi:MAG: hypothetical protein MUE68_05170 [Bacteroidetes bacterium]|jgi:hypothetical protein|nr:hypothetical protein [Bacteroidota bacterium]
MVRSVLHRRILLAGGIWNLAMGIPITLLVPWLPALLKIEEPRFPIFIYFNLMTVTMFGFVALTMARHLAAMRPLLPVLVWSKVLTFGVFIAAVLWLPMPRELTEFLAGGMVVDLILGLLYWRIWVETKA